MDAKHFGYVVSPKILLKKLVLSTYKDKGVANLIAKREPAPLAEHKSRIEDLNPEVLDVLVVLLLSHIGVR
jgi:hypothetical protein